MVVLRNGCIGDFISVKTDLLDPYIRDKDKDILKEFGKALA